MPEDPIVDEDGVEWVLITHPDIKAEPARVTKTSFDEVYSQQEKPWKLYEPKETKKATSKETKKKSSSDDATSSTSSAQSTDASGEAK